MSVDSQTQVQTPSGNEESKGAFTSSPTPRLVLGADLSTSRALDALTDYDDLDIERWPAIGPLRQRAFELRESVSAYDAAYVSLAEALECPLITRDSPLSKSSGHNASIELW